jgi:hypothetical protein
MRAIRIHDCTPEGVLAFDLAEVLAALGTSGRSAFWTVGGVASKDERLFATGKGMSELEGLASCAERVPRSRLAEIARDVRQVIWGEFKGYADKSSEDPIVVITAVDSSWWEVQSTNAGLLDRVARTFEHVGQV